MGVGFAALQGDADGHLTDGAAGQGVGPAEVCEPSRTWMPKARPWRTSRSSSKAESWAMRSSSTNSSWNSSITSRIRGSRGLRLRRAVALDVLQAVAAEQIAPGAQLVVEPLQDAHAELPLALDRHHPRVRQAGAGVGLELDALLEVDQVQFHLVGAVTQREVGDQHVEQGRFARAGLAGDQDVLRSAVAEAQQLELHGARPAQGHVDAGAAVGGPPFVIRRDDAGEGHLDPAGVFGRAADRADDLLEALDRRRHGKIDRHRPVVAVLEDESFLGPARARPPRPPGRTIGSSAAGARWCQRSSARTRRSGPRWPRCS